MNTDHSQRQWTGQTDGLPWMLRSLIGMLRIIPLFVIYGVVDIVILFYMLFRPSATKAQYQLFHLRFGRSKIRSLVSAYLNMRQFGKVVVDRFAVYADKQFNITIDNSEWLEQCYNSELPLVILSGHIGNFELAGYFLRPKNKQMYVVMYGGDKAVVMQNRAKYLTPNDIHLIIAQDNSDYLFQINSALANGDMLAILADRVFGSKRTLTTEILGAPAHLPLGPFRTALLRPANICAVFAIKQDTGNYTIHITPLDAATPQQLADSYSQTIDTIMHRYPYQWFNYYNFWND